MRDDVLSLYMQPQAPHESVAIFDFALWLVRNPDPGDAVRRACFQPWERHVGVREYLDMRWGR